MEFRCEDLRDFGLELVPPSSPDYDPLLADIQRRIKYPPEKWPLSAILLNRSEKSIAAMEVVWRYEDAGGRAWTGSHTMIFARALLLPTFPQLSSMKRLTYWNTIMPGSKRYLAEPGDSKTRTGDFRSFGSYFMAGDNADVRPPEPGEILTSGGGEIRGGGHGCVPPPDLSLITLILDGVFFADGEFVGPDRFGLWELVTLETKSRLEVGRAAAEGRNCGVAAADILEEIGKMTGPATARELRLPSPGPITPEWVLEIAQREQQRRAKEIEGHRRHNGDEGTVEWLESMAKTQLPDLRKR
jgi:hypothetical protein